MQYNTEENLLRIREEIAPYKPNIIAVTKYFDEDAIVSAYNAGLRDFGESRAVEAVQKISNLSDEVKSNSKFHFIGHLQTNKARLVVSHFDYIHSVDSLKLASVISDEAQRIGKVQNILIQLNNAEEVQKFGLSIKEIFEIFPQIQKLPSLNVVGIMNMAPLGASDSELDRLFGEVCKVRDDLQNTFDCELKEISMGMSQDYKIAVKHGATMLRIGRKLFK